MILRSAFLVLAALAGAGGVELIDFYESYPSLPSTLPSNSTVALLIRGKYGQSSINQSAANVLIATRSKAEMLCAPLIQRGNKIRVFAVLEMTAAIIPANGQLISPDALTLNDAITNILKEHCDKNSVLKVMVSHSQRDSLVAAIDLLQHAAGEPLSPGQRPFSLVLLTRQDFGFTRPITDWGGADFSKFNFYALCEGYPLRRSNQKPSARIKHVSLGWDQLENQDPCVTDHLHVFPFWMFPIFLNAINNVHQCSDGRGGQRRCNCFSAPSGIEGGHQCGRPVLSKLNTTQVGLLTGFRYVKGVREETNIGCVIPIWTVTIDQCSLFPKDDACLNPEAQHDKTKTHCHCWGGDRKKLCAFQCEESTLLCPLPSCCPTAAWFDTMYDVNYPELRAPAEAAEK
jgi:hypothetical protein